MGNGVRTDAATLDDVRRWPAVVGLERAASALGIGRTTAYDLAHRDDFPVRVLVIGGRRKVATADLLRLLDPVSAETADN